MGVAWALLTAFLYALANVYNHRASQRFTALEMMTFFLTLQAAAYALLIPFLWARQGGLPLREPVGVLLCGAAGIAGTLLSRWGLLRTIVLLGPSRASTLKNSAPAFSLLVAALWLRQVPSPAGLAGIALILAGIAGLGRERTALRLRPETVRVRAGAPAFAGGAGTRALGEGEAGFAPSPRANPHEDQPWSRLGILLGLVTACMAGTSDVLRAAALRGIPHPVWASALASWWAWLGLVVYLAASRQLRSCFARAACADADLIRATSCSILSQLTNFLAVQQLLAPYVSALIGTAPFFTALLNTRLGREDEGLNLAFWASAFLLVGGAALISLYG